MLLAVYERIFQRGSRICVFQINEIILSKFKSVPFLMPNQQSQRKHAHDPGRDGDVYRST